MIDDKSGYENKFNAAEEFLNSLKSRIEGEVSFDVKRDIVRLLIKEIRINTIHSEKEKGRPTATIDLIFNFNFKGILRTGEREDNNSGMHIRKILQTKPKINQSPIKDMSSKSVRNKTSKSDEHINHTLNISGFKKLLGICLEKIAFILFKEIQSILF